jgi:hypothetical protein
LWIVYNLSIQSDKAIWLIAKDDRFGCLSAMTKPYFDVLLVFGFLFSISLKGSSRVILTLKSNLFDI